MQTKQQELRRSVVAFHYMPRHAQGQPGIELMAYGPRGGQRLLGCMSIDQAIALYQRLGEALKECGHPQQES